MPTPNAQLLVIDRHGVYIPHLFAKHYREDITNAKELTNALDDLGNPESETYWDSWETVLDRARMRNSFFPETEFVLHQDGDLWQVPIDEVDQIPEI